MICQISNNIVKKTVRYLVLLHFLSNVAFAQQYMSKEGSVHFFSQAPIENIEAENNTVAGIIDVANGEYAFRVKIEDFRFAKPLMQEHFNENYMESQRYPFATFTGFMTDFQELDLSDKQLVQVKGNMSMHGVDQSINVEASVWMQDGELHLTSKFWVKLVDYKIDIPKIVMYNIAEEIEVTIQMQLSKVK